MYIGTALLLPGVRQVLTVTILGTRCDWANWTGTLSGYSFYCVRFWTKLFGNDCKINTHNPWKKNMPPVAESFATSAKLFGRSSRH